MTKMKAAYFNEHGPPDVLTFGELSKPNFEDDEVLISVRYCALNRLDLFTRKGTPNLKMKLPHVGGADFVGEISQIGSEVVEFEVGDQVVVNAVKYCNLCTFCRRGEQSLCEKFHMIGEHVWGGFAEFVSVPARNCLKIPIGVDLKTVASLGLTGLTAWRMLSSKANLKPGQTVLIPGAGGGLSVAGLQIAKHLGAFVIAVTSTKEKEQLVQELGADLVLNYGSDPDWAKKVWNYTNKTGVDVVFESVGQATWNTSLRSLKKGGVLVTAGATTGFNGETNIGLVFYKQLQILGSTMANQSEFIQAMELIFQGKIKPVIDKEFSLSELREAHEYLEGGLHKGKIIIKI